MRYGVLAGECGGLGLLLLILRLLLLLLLLLLLEKNNENKKNTTEMATVWTKIQQIENNKQNWMAWFDEWMRRRGVRVTLRRVELF